MKKDTRTAAQQPETQKDMAKNNAAHETNPMITVYDGGITEEIVHGRLDTKLNFLFARNWGSYPLKDGRYVYEEWTGSKKNLHLKKKVYSGLNRELLQFLTKTDRKATNSQRKAKEHADYGVRLEDGEDENDFYRPSVMDKVAYQQWVHQETWEEGEDDPIYPDELLKQDFVPGDNKVNNQRWQMRRQVIEQFIPNLSLKDQEAIIKYYGMCMTEEQIGVEEGLNKQAICNRLTRAKEDLRKVFALLGIPIPSDEELEEERKKRKTKDDAAGVVEKERKKDEREARTIRTIMRQENTQGSSSEPEREEDEETEESKEESYDDFDPDNPYDSVSEDFDPYEEYDIYKDEESDEDYWRNDTEE